MGQAAKLIERILGISGDTPYRGKLVSASGRNVHLEGDTVFKIDNGQVTFRLFLDPGTPHLSPYEAFKEANSPEGGVILDIPDREFTHAVLGLSGPIGERSEKRTHMEGHVDLLTFGSTSEPQGGVQFWLCNLPRGWYGKDTWKRFWGVTRDEITFSDNGGAQLPDWAPIGLEALGGFSLSAGDWDIFLRETCQVDDVDPDVTHLGLITRTGDGVTGPSVQDFVEQYLGPFLCFVFGQQINFAQMEGTAWGMVFPQQPVIPRTRRGNWFLRSRGDIDLSLLFDQFYRLDPAVRKRWHRVIDAYVASEEIMGTLFAPDLAASISFASLEGLTRSFISTYETKEEWLNSDLSLRRNKRIIDAIEMVARREFGSHSETFKRAADQVRHVRNATMHVDLESELDAQNASHRWNSSQALVEILILNRLGLSEIPNRTAYGTFNVMGQDMYAQVRKEELRFGQ